MATSSTMAAHSSSSSTFISPDPQTLNKANDPSPPTDSSQPSKLPQTAEETTIVIGENISMEEEEEEECGFCLFMKGGGCKESFVAWEKCVEEAEKSGENVVSKCKEVTSLLRKCMDDHSNYYEPILRAEREMENAISESEVEKEMVKGEDT